MQRVRAGISHILSFLTMSLLVLYSTLITSREADSTGSITLLRLHRLASRCYSQFIEVVKFTLA